MHVISRAPFDEAARHYPNDAAAIDDTYRVLKRVVAKKGRCQAFSENSLMAESLYGTWG
ncbi:hypothetical protein NUKP33_44450 [Klebsiella variicola]|nr:hypothetical protein NUKP33_44450 [Klebsiella variicola]GKL61006.1 hypothetical protein NUKP61_40700 [Klebsiella variicola]